jgi:predicted nucleic-acid-binding protein
MIALDTNVLVRFLVEDDVDQTRRATALVRAAVDRDIALFVADVVICELVREDRFVRPAASAVK